MRVKIQYRKMTNAFEFITDSLVHAEASTALGVAIRTVFVSNNDGNLTHEISLSVPEAEHLVKELKEAIKMAKNL